MAPGSCATRRTNPPVSSGPSEAPSDRDELTSNTGPFKPPAPAADTPAPSISKYTEEDLLRILKTVFETRAPAPAPVPEGPRERPLKARFPDVYKGVSQMECYNFCQQCEDHFDTAGAKGPNRIPFAAFFLRGRINFCWQQYKRKLNSAVPITWIEFKAFLRQALGDSRAFAESIWRKVKRLPISAQRHPGLGRSLGIPASRLSRIRC